MRSTQRPSSTRCSPSILRKADIRRRGSGRSTPQLLTRDLSRAPDAHGGASVIKAMTRSPSLISASSVKHRRRRSPVRERGLLRRGRQARGMYTTAHVNRPHTGAQRSFPLTTSSGLCCKSDSPCAGRIPKRVASGAARRHGHHPLRHAPSAGRQKDEQAFPPRFAMSSANVGAWWAISAGGP